MPYYGDHLAGDPGLFSFVKKIRLGRVVGGLVKSIPGAAGVLSAVNAVREAAGAGRAQRPISISPPPAVLLPSAPIPNPALTTGARPRTKRRATRRRAPARRLSPLAARRRSRLRNLGYRV